MATLVSAVSRLLGWSYFACWSVSFYPQLVANHRRKSVTGLAVDFFAVNVLGFLCYSISSILFLCSPVVREQYARRHPGSPEPTVRWNDLAFAVHATVVSSAMLSQFYCWGYTRSPRQQLSRAFIALISACISALMLALLFVLFPRPDWEWIDVVYTLQYIKLLISVVKYVPQAYLNYKRRATTGWSIHNILLDFSGGALSLAQLVLDSSLQADWSGITGNPVKFFLSQISIFFDILFILQHYVFYRLGNSRTNDIEYSRAATGIPEGEEEEEVEIDGGENENTIAIERGYDSIQPAVSISVHDDDHGHDHDSAIPERRYRSAARSSDTGHGGEEERRGLLSSRSET